MRPHSLVPLFVLVTGVACSGGGEGTNIDWIYFNPIPDIADIDLARINPAEPFVYLELRQARADPYYYDLDEYDVLSSHGTPCADATDPSACNEALHTAQPDPHLGFQWGCHPSDCYKYFVVNRGDEVATLASAAEVLALLGRIDNREEAILLAASHSYWWSVTDRSKGGIRNVAFGGFELIVTRTTFGCDLPVYLLGIASSGSVTIIESWTRESWEGCDPSLEYQ